MELFDLLESLADIRTINIIFKLCYQRKLRHFEIIFLTLTSLSIGNKMERTCNLIYQKTTVSPAIVPVSVSYFPEQTGALYPRIFTSKKSVSTKSDFVLKNRFSITAYHCLAKQKNFYEKFDKRKTL